MESCYPGRPLSPIVFRNRYNKSSGPGIREKIPCRFCRNCRFCRFSGAWSYCDISPKRLLSNGFIGFKTMGIKNML